jgi:hypothetical protein
MAVAGDVIDNVGGAHMMVWRVLASAPRWITVLSGDRSIRAYVFISAKLDLGPSGNGRTGVP